MLFQRVMCNLAILQGGILPVSLELVLQSQVLLISSYLVVHVLPARLKNSL
jgi:hypothetical protein